MTTVTQQPAQELLTVEQYDATSEMDVVSELVKGRIAPLEHPTRRKGMLCVEIGSRLCEYVNRRRLGRVVSNFSEVITCRWPASVRGADLAYYSFARTSDSKLRDNNRDAIPDLVFEVRDKCTRWPFVLEKVAEFLQAGVDCVCVVDPEPQTVHVYRAEQPVQLLTADQDFTLPELFPDFRVKIREFFE